MSGESGLEMKVMIKIYMYISLILISIYSLFHITFPRGVTNFVGKLGTSLRSSQLRGELDNQIANFDLKFPTCAALNFATSHI